MKISPIEMLSSLTPEKGRVLDVGCGCGLSTWIIGHGKPDLKVHGIDIDKKKIEAAKKYFNSPNITYRYQDINNFDSNEKYDAVIVSDTLYLIPYHIQDKFISKIITILKEDREFILKEMAPKPRWKYYFNILQETIAVKLTGFTFGEKFYFQSSAEYHKLFKKQGLSFKEIPIKGYCYPHIYYIGRLTSQI